MPTAPYYTKDGKRVPGVTTILGPFHPGGIEGLLYWANNLGLEGQSHKEARDKAAEAGTVAHAMAAAHITGEPLPDLSPYEEEVRHRAQEGYGSFLEWCERTHLEWTASELHLVSETHRFGGTPDAIARLGDDGFVLVDFKATNALRRKSLIQLAGYLLLVEENRPHERISRVALLRFGEEGAFDDQWRTVEQIRRVAMPMFLWCLELYQMDKKLKKLAGG